MSENQKKTLLIVLVVIGVIAAGYSAYNAFTPPKEEVVGTLDMGPQGGKAAEQGQTQPGQPPAADPSGMPPELANPGGGR